jgi:hypothetical protein
VLSYNARPQPTGGLNRQDRVVSEVIAKASAMHRAQPHRCPPCGQMKPAQCTIWHELFNATGSTPPYPGAPNNWKACGGSAQRDDRCSCGGRNCDPNTVQITTVNLFGNNLDRTTLSSVGSLTALNEMWFGFNSSIQAPPCHSPSRFISVHPPACISGTGCRIVHGACFV